MHTLVVYGSKNGYARECAQKVAQSLTGETELVDIRNRSKLRDLSRFDQVLAGGSVRAGRLNGSLRKFLESHREELMQKRLGLFLCSTTADNIETQFETYFPNELLHSAIAKSWFGGRIVFAQQNPIMRMMLKKILKGESDVHLEQPEAITAFVTACSS